MRPSTAGGLEYLLLLRPCARQSRRAGNDRLRHRAAQTRLCRRTAHPRGRPPDRPGMVRTATGHREHRLAGLSPSECGESTLEFVGMADVIACPTASRVTAITGGR